MLTFGIMTSDLLLPRHPLMQKLAQINEYLIELNNQEKNFSAQDVKYLIDNLKTTIQSILPAELDKITAQNLTYEFFDAVSDVTENISALRLSEKNLRQTLSQEKVFQLFDDFVQALTQTVFLHESLRDEKPTQLTLAKNAAEALKQAEKAAQTAAEASAAAQRANADSAKHFDEVMQRQQHTGEIHPDLFQNAQSKSLEMYAKNAAAILAADVSAATIANLEELADAEKNHRSSKS